MNTALSRANGRQPTDWNTDTMQRRIQARYRTEKRFRLYGLFAVLLSAGVLAFLLLTMVSGGARGFTQVQIALPVNFPVSDIFLEPSQLKGEDREQLLAQADFRGSPGKRQSTPMGRTDRRFFRTVHGSDCATRYRKIPNCWPATKRCGCQPRPKSILPPAAIWARARAKSAWRWSSATVS